MVQGERELVSDCRSLARFELHGIPAMVAGAARIRVTFSVDADGLLQVEAREQTSGVSAQIEVKPSYGLSDDEISGMLQASIEHAAGDVALRRLAEARVEAQRVIEALNAAMERDAADLLSDEESARVQSALQRLVEFSAQSQDAAEVEAAVKQLEEGCEFYVERRMNHGIRQAMAGHRVDEFTEEGGPKAD